MRSILKITLILAAMFAFSNTALSQTKAPVKKAPVKKAPAKKAPVAINVYVCTSNKDKFYHKRSSCMGMNKCTETIKNVKSSSELAKYKRKKCTRCKP